MGAGPQRVRIEGLGRGGGEAPQVQLQHRIQHGHLLRLLLFHPREQSRHVKEAAVTVEVNNLVGPPLGNGAAQSLSQPLERGRAEHVEVEGRLRLLAEAFQDARSDRPRRGLTVLFEGGTFAL
ncbi:MAG TPA: hypothetical protein VN999_11740 [Thermoanaerobaculia bacterium]|nr:hypothetical protein [Thermoanaerobaculia bacterium]